jgi:hypothetical protein
MPAVLAFTQKYAFGKVLVFLVDLKLPQIGGDIIALGSHFLDVNVGVKKVIVGPGHDRFHRFSMLRSAHFVFE